MLTYTCEQCERKFEARLKPMGISRGLIYPVEKDHQIIYEVAFSENDLCYYCKPSDEEEE